MSPNDFIGVVPTSYLMFFLGIPFQEPSLSQSVSLKDIMDLGPTPEKMMEQDSQSPVTPSPAAPQLSQLEQSPAATELDASGVKGSVKDANSQEPELETGVKDLNSQAPGLEAEVKDPKSQPPSGTKNGTVPEDFLGADLADVEAITLIKQKSS